MTGDELSSRSSSAGTQWLESTAGDRIEILLGHAPICIKQSEMALLDPLKSCPVALVFRSSIGIRHDDVAGEIGSSHAHDLGLPFRYHALHLVTCPKCCRQTYVVTGEVTKFHAVDVRDIQPQRLLQNMPPLPVLGGHQQWTTRWSISIVVERRLCDPHSLATLATGSGPSSGRRSPRRGWHHARPSVWTQQR